MKSIKMQTKGEAKTETKTKSSNKVQTATPSSGQRGQVLMHVPGLRTLRQNPKLTKTTSTFSISVPAPVLGTSPKNNPFKSKLKSLFTSRFQELKSMVFKAKAQDDVIEKARARMKRERLIRSRCVTLPPVSKENEHKLASVVGDDGKDYSYQIINKYDHFESKKPTSFDKDQDQSCSSKYKYEQFAFNGKVKEAMENLNIPPSYYSDFITQLDTMMHQANQYYQGIDDANSLGPGNEWLMECYRSAVCMEALYLMMQLIIREIPTLENMIKSKNSNRLFVLMNLAEFAKVRMSGASPFSKPSYSDQAPPTTQAPTGSVPVAESKKHLHCSRDYRHGRHGDNYNNNNQSNDANVVEKKNGKSRGWSFKSVMCGFLQRTESEDYDHKHHTHLNDDKSILVNFHFACNSSVFKMIQKYFQIWGYLILDLTSFSQGSDEMKILLAKMDAFHFDTPENGKYTNLHAQLEEAKIIPYHQTKRGINMDDKVDTQLQDIDEFNYELSKCKYYMQKMSGYQQMCMIPRTRVMN